MTEFDYIHIDPAIKKQLARHYSLMRKTRHPHNRTEFDEVQCRKCKNKFSKTLMHRRTLYNSYPSGSLRKRYEYFCSKCWPLMEFRK